MRNFLGLPINIFLQWSHCFSEPMIYWSCKTILITPHQSIVIDKSCDKNAAPTLNFFELSNEDTPQFSQGYVFNLRLGCGSSKKYNRSFPMMKAWLAFMFKNICEGNRRRGLAKIPYLLTMVLGDLF